MDKKFRLGPGILPRFIGSGKEEMTLRDIIAELKRMYCKLPNVPWLDQR